jgi:hypothetical protein
MLLFDFLLRSENFKESLNKENVVSRVFLFGLFIWPNWELGNPSHLAIFSTHTTAMVSPRSVELKQGAKELSMEEEKRCKLKLPVEIKRTARIQCGGRVPTVATSRNPIKEEKVPTPVLRSACIRGMKRKDYKEVSPEPEDYGDSDYSTIVARARRRTPEEMITICTFGKRCPRRRLPKAPTAAETTTAAMTAETLAMTNLSGCIRCVVQLAVTPSRSSTHRSTNVSRTWRR